MGVFAVAGAGHVGESGNGFFTCLVSLVLTICEDSLWTDEPFPQVTIKSMILLPLNKRTLVLLICELGIGVSTRQVDRSPKIHRLPR